MNKLIGIAGIPNTGKSTSLQHLTDKRAFAYFNADGKALPIRGGNKGFLLSEQVTDPVDITDFYDQLEEADECKGVVLDTLTHLMSAYERQHVLTAVNTQQAWGQYAVFYNNMMDKIKQSNKTHIIMMHTGLKANETTGDVESRVLVKGAVGNLGPESDFSVIVTTKQMPVSKLKAYETPLLTFTEEEEARGMKYVFCTSITRATVGERTRAPRGFWELNEMYIDNNIQHVIDRFDSYYGL